tara:strand:- start:288 stop:1082 length:795 start_codon:yes stop_codon:yes gene_type:complete
MRVKISETWEDKKMSRVMIGALAFVMLFAFSCGTMNSSVKNDFPREGFAFISKTVQLKRCFGKDNCATMDLRSSGSGYVVKLSDKGAYIVTAAHVCDGEKGLLESVEQTIHMRVSTLSLKRYDAIVLKKDQSIDACLLFAEGLTEGVEVIPLATKPPKRGEKVYNIAAPLGMFDYDMVPVFEGRYAGEENGQDVYSLAATFGSSGSMILNSKGELVGMVHSVLVKFRNIAISSPYEKLMEFIRSGLSKAELAEWMCIPEECVDY